MIVYLIEGNDPLSDYRWIEPKAYLDEEQASKMRLALEEVNKEEDSPEEYRMYFYVKKVEVV